MRNAGETAEGVGTAPLPRPPRALAADVPRRLSPLPGDSPTRLRALSADAELLRVMCEEGLQGRVHSVFERVVNIDGGGRGLFTLAARDLDEAPDTVVVDTPGFATTGIRAGDGASAAGRALRVGGRLEIALDAATGWEARLVAHRLHPARLEANLASVRAHLSSRGVARGGHGPVQARSPLAVLGSRMLEERAAELCDALCRGDVAAACRHGRAMIGLGAGLTPSGDDFLLGLFGALHATEGPCEAMKGLGAVIAGEAAQRTNSISAAALEAAARGRVRNSIHGLLRDMLTGRCEAATASMRRVLAIGSTSGADIVAGVVAGFDVVLRCARSRRHRIEQEASAKWKHRSNFPAA